MDIKTIKIIIIAILFMFIGLFDYLSVTVVLPHLTNILHTDIVLTNWISISLLLFCVASGLSFGRIIPKVGILKIGKIAITATIICGLISALILNPGVIIIARSIQGLCASAMAISAYMLISKFIDEKYLGIALGFVTAGTFLSSATAPIIGGLISYYLPPQIIFVFTLPLSIIALILIWTLNNEWKEDIKLDYIGTVLSFISMILFVLGVSNINKPTGILCFVISTILFIIFIIYELKLTHPLYDFRLLKNKVYAANNYSAMIGCFVKDGMIFVLILYLQYTKGFNSIETGAITSTLIILMLLTSPLAGKLSTHINSVKLSNIGIFLMIISTILFCLINLIPQLNIFIPIIFLGIGYALFDTPNKKIILKSAKDSELSYVSAFLNTIRDFGMMVPTVLFTLILTLIPNKNMAEIYGKSSQIMFIIFFIAALSSLILSLYFNRNLKIIYKIDLKNIIKPLTTNVGNATNIIYEVQESMTNTVNDTINELTNTQNQLYNKMTDIPDNVSNVVDEIEIPNFLKNKK